MLRHQLNPITKRSLKSAHRSRISTFKPFRPAVELLERRELPSNTPNQLYVAQAYRDALAREADAASLAYWSGQLDHGMSRLYFAASLTRSAEYSQTAVIGVAF